MMRKLEIDELKVYRGEDYRLTDKIKVRQPTLGEVCGLGDSDSSEQRFFQTAYSLIATPTDMMTQIEDCGMRYEDITNFTLFCMLFPQMPKENTRLLLGGDLDPRAFRVEVVENQDRIVLIDPDMRVIDEYVYEGLVAYICYLLGTKQSMRKVAGNKLTRELMMEDARSRAKHDKDKPYKSVLKPLISTMVNSEGFKAGWDTVWDMKLGAFMDSVVRIQTIVSAKALLSGCYSGNVNIKKLNKNELNYMRDLAKPSA